MISNVKTVEVVGTNTRAFGLLLCLSPASVLQSLEALDVSMGKHGGATVQRGTGESQLLQLPQEQGACVHSDRAYYRRQTWVARSQYSR